jgi:hypothetical protein
MMPYRIPKDGIPYGGDRGEEFDDFTWLGGPDDAYVYSLQVNHGETLDHLVVTYLQGGQQHVRTHGGDGGSTVYDPWVIDVNNNERLVKVELWLHFYSGDTYELNGLRFTKSIWRPGHPLTFRPSPLFGGGGDPQVLEVPGASDPQAPWRRAHSKDPVPGEICAFFGRQGTFVDALGIWVRGGAIGQPARQTAFQRST